MCMGEVKELMKHPPKEKVKAKFLDFVKNGTHQVDLWSAPHDEYGAKTYKYAVVVVDTHSSKADARPLQIKSPPEVLAALEKIYKGKYLR